MIVWIMVMIVMIKTVLMGMMIIKILVWYRCLLIVILILIAIRIEE